MLKQRTVHSRMNLRKRPWKDAIKCWPSGCSSGEAVLFGTLFATFLALRNQTNEGPSAAELFHLPLVAAATLLLLVSSLTSVFAIQAMHRGMWPSSGTGCW